MKAATHSVRAGLLSVFILSGFASAPAFAQSALTPEQLTLRVERLTELSQRSEAKLSTAQAQLKTLTGEMSRLGRLIDNRAMLEMIQQVDQLSEEISLLRGEVEVQTNDIGEIKKRQRELYLDIDRRLRELESGAAARAPAPQTSVPAVTGNSQPVVPSVEATVPQPITNSTTASASQTPSVTQSEERAAYQSAFDKIKEGRYKNAKTELNAFLKKFPNSSYAGNVQYWLGEVHFATRNFDQGIVEFSKVVNDHPGSNKVPDALLKLGYTYYELKQFPKAKSILQDLGKRYPNTTAARLATKRLDRIRKEGN
ncbi:MAG: tol-pal system protein YbgF [Gammaproteobacteria bacterium]|nr:tol-pal system protein YbgF [Gammaproteobacteria bacterium]